MLNNLRLLVYVDLILFCATIHAQELSVKSFEEKTTDLSASTSVRNDNNDIPCALIKVHLAANNAKFEGALVGDVAYKTSEYWVYMPKGSKRLTVKLEGYLPLSVQFSDYGINSLESKMTYLLTISGVIVNGQIVEQRTMTGWIILDTEPIGASVYINDEYAGNTPLDVKQPYGTYSYRVEKPNYHSVSGTFELNTGRFEKKEVLPPAFGTISVRGSVTGATVLLDNKDTGKKTPCVIKEVASGQHAVTLQMEKYAPRQYTVTVNDGETSTLNANLDARFAKISIQTLQDADIYIDNVKKNKTSYEEDLMEGYYDIEVKKEHYRSATKQIQVLAGKNQEIELKPTPIYGSLDIVSNPRKAQVSIDGKVYGETPLTIDQLLEGRHSVTISMDGYASETKMVSITENGTSSISATLQNGREISISVRNSEAHIYVDGQDMGTSTFLGNLTFGQHSAYAFLDGRKTDVLAISVEPEGSNTYYTLDFTKVFSVNGVSFEMAYVAVADFTMGATSEMIEARVNEKPAHEVSMTGDYYMGVTEVTQTLWKAVMGRNPSEFKGDNNPVECISWDNCREFLSKLNALTGKNFRLPSEKEWEFAARGGIYSKHYQYSGSDEIDDVAWYIGNSGRKSHQVATKRPNELGIYDMTGNVLEWCSDWFVEYGSNQNIDPNKSSNHVIRGGCWNYPIKACHSSWRGPLSRELGGSHLGMRLVLSVSDENHTLKSPSQPEHSSVSVPTGVEIKTDSRSTSNLVEQTTKKSSNGTVVKGRNTGTTRSGGTSTPSRVTRTTSGGASIPSRVTRTTRNPYYQRSKVQ